MLSISSREEQWGKAMFVFETCMVNFGDGVEILSMSVAVGHETANQNTVHLLGGIGIGSVRGCSFQCTRGCPKKAVRSNLVAGKVVALSSMTMAICFQRHNICWSFQSVLATRGSPAAARAFIRQPLRRRNQVCCLRKVQTRVGFSLARIGDDEAVTGRQT